MGRGGADADALSVAWWFGGSYLLAKVNDRHFTNVCSIISWRIFRIRNAALRCSSMNDRQLQRPALDCLFWSVPIRRHFR